MIKAAYLRVYLPEDAPPVRDLPEATWTSRPPVASSLGLTTEPPGEDAFVAEWRGRMFRCPRTPQVRMLEGLLALRAASAQLGAMPLISEPQAREAKDRLDEIQRSGRGTAHILTSAWHVPLRWFALFSPDSRDLLEDPIRIRYRDFVGAGLARLDRAISILDEAEVPDPIIDEVRGLRSWLEEFSLDAMVELDYGSVAGSFDTTDLVLDDSAADLWAALEGLANDDWEMAGERYGDLVARWAVPMAVSYSN